LGNFSCWPSNTADQPDLCCLTSRFVDLSAANVFEKAYRDAPAQSISIPQIFLSTHHLGEQTTPTGMAARPLSGPVGAKLRANRLRCRPRRRYVSRLRTVLPPSFGTW